MAQLNTDYSDAFPSIDEDASRFRKPLQEPQWSNQKLTLRAEELACKAVEQLMNTCEHQRWFDDWAQEPLPRKSGIALFDLPVAIRLKIYAYLLPDHSSRDSYNVISITPKPYTTCIREFTYIRSDRSGSQRPSGHDPSPLPLLLINRQIYKEALPLLYKDAVFHPVSTPCSNSFICSLPRFGIARSCIRTIRLQLFSEDLDFLRDAKTDAELRSQYAYWICVCNLIVTHLNSSLQVLELYSTWPGFVNTRRMSDLLRPLLRIRAEKRFLLVGMEDASAEWNTPGFKSTVAYRLNQGFQEYLQREEHETREAAVLTRRYWGTPVAPDLPQSAKKRLQVPLRRNAFCAPESTVYPPRPNPPLEPFLVEEKLKGDTTLPKPSKFDAAVEEPTSTLEVSTKDSFNKAADLTWRLMKRLQDPLHRNAICAPESTVYPSRSDPLLKPCVEADVSKVDTSLPIPSKLDTAVAVSAPMPEVCTRDSGEILEESREKVLLMINEYQNRHGIPESHSPDGLFAPLSYYLREGSDVEDHAPQGQEKPQVSDSSEEDWDLVSVRSDTSVAVTDCWAVEENGSQIGNWQHVYFPDSPKSLYLRS